MLWSAFLIGLFGSFHCIGMCGPIALALPIQNKSTINLISGRLLYNVGRAITYAVIGAMILLGAWVIANAITGTVCSLYGTSAFNASDALKYLILHFFSFCLRRSLLPC